MSEHVWVQENIAAYVAGGLDFVESERLEKHAAECSACAQALDAARALDRKLAPIFARANPGPALEDRIIRSLPAAPPSKRQLRLTWHYKTLLAAAAVLLFVLTGALISSVLDSSVVNTQSEDRLLGFYMGGNRSAEPGRSGARLGVDVVGGTILTHEYNESPQLPSADEMAKSLRSVVTILQDSSESMSENERQQGLSSFTNGTNRKVTESVVVGKTERGYVTPNGASPPPKKMPDWPNHGYRNTSPAPSFAAPGGSPPPAPAPVTPTTLPPVLTGPAATPPPSSVTTPSPSLPGPTPSVTYTGSEGKEGKDKSIFRYENKGNLPPLKGDFFKPNEELAGGDKTGDDKKDIKNASPKNGDKGEKGPDPKATKETSPPREPDKGAGNELQKPEDPKPEPPSAPKKMIIRSGDFEFEVDSFDDSVLSILRLIQSIKGAYLATNNSEKLPNGKVRGSVVVRVPPEQMSDFILELRKVLKNAELKNQRIGSIDVSKQYTDLESHLRGARTMEQRLLAIIKEGKGQIKDLLQAEKELGVWRTRVEEIEGELRYYANLASMATVTIKLSERNITSASAIFENECVQAGIEVEDVEKASDLALKAIAEAKGRVTRSEVRQRAAGQFNAILHFEVAPESAGMMRDMLRQLGHMARLQIDRVQQTEHGGAPPRDGKLRRGATQFEVSLYNLANVTPRETVVLRVAAIDVPAIYRKLREAIGKAKGHVLNAQLDEQDRQNVQAQLDFHVRRTNEGEVLADIMAAGELLSRQVNRVPEGENVTDANVRIRLSLVDADALPPRETATMKIVVADVQAAYQKVRDALAKVKARVITASVDEQDTLNVTAKLDFTVRRSDESAIQANLTGAGEVLSRHVTRPAESANVTDAKVRIQLDLVQAGSLQARETATVKIAVVDVRAAYQKLRDALAKVKARINTASVNEQDTRNVTAKLDFTVNRSDESAIQANLTGAGEVLSRHVTRPAEGANVTDAKVRIQLDLVDAGSLPPRETTTLKLASVDVKGAFESLRDAVAKAKGRLIHADLSEQDRRNITGRLQFHVPRSEEPAMQAALAAAGETLTRQAERKQEDGNVTDTKVGFDVSLMAAASITPRETTTLAIEAPNVANVVTLASAEVKEAQGHTVDTKIGRERSGQVTARVIFDVPYSQSAALVEKFKESGIVRLHEVSRDPQAPEGKLALARISLIISNTPLVPTGDQGVSQQIRSGLSFSLYGLAVSAKWLIVGLLFVLPWALLLYAVYWLARRMWAAPELATVPAAETPGSTTQP